MIDSTVALRLSTRIGSSDNPSAPCTGHRTAKGLRLYCDAKSQPVRINYIIEVSELPSIRD